MILSNLIYIHRTMLKIIRDITDPLLDLVQDDPVRPEISREFRITQNRFIMASVDDRPLAVVCIGLRDRVPEDVEDLAGECLQPTTAVFYTIWSYVAGSGAQLIFDAVDAIREEFPTVTRFVTLSPKTEMARRFHLRNGACVLRENQSTINYEYVIGD